MAPEQKPPESPRKRIVINLDQSHGKTVTRGARRWPKVVGALGIVTVTMVVLAAAGSYLWWSHYKTTAAYSLALLVDAAQRNDMTAVDQQVDVDKIVNELTAHLTEKTLGRYGSALSSFVTSSTGVQVTSLLPGRKQIVRDLLVKRLREIAERSDHKPFVVMAISLPYFVTIATEGDTAKIATTARDQPVELTMQRDGQRWKVTALRDESIVQSIVDDLIKDLPAIAQQPDEEKKSPVQFPRPRIRRRR